MSWLEDFADGEAIWQGLMRSPSFDVFLTEMTSLTSYEWQHVLLYHGIAEKQASGEWSVWTEGR